MTDSHMTDNNPNNNVDRNDEPQPPVDPRLGPSDVFRKRTIKRLGERGTDIIEDGNKHTILDDGTQVVDVTIHNYCMCGNSITHLEKTNRCVTCDDLCCTDCRIRLSRRSYCPDCAEEKFTLSKPAYLTLYMLNEHVRTATDLITTTQTDTGETVIQIDTALPPLLENDYLRIDTPEPAGDNAGGEEAEPALGIPETDPLSNAGKEALHVGEKLYSDDPDVKHVKEQFHITKITNGR